MAVYKLKAKGNYGDMPKGYEFQVASPTTPTPNAQDVEKEIARLGFNKQAQSYKSAGNFELKKDNNINRSSFATVFNDQQVMDKIKLNDILKLENLDNIKFRLNLSNASWNALEHYHNNPDHLLVGHFHNSPKRKWFKENQIVIGLAQIKNDDWLLIDISRITKSYNNFWDEKPSSINTFYEHKKLPEFEKYVGRLIVQFHKENAYVTLAGNRIDDFIVKEILPSSLDKDLFPGYDKVNISWSTMKRVLEKDTWRTALENQKGVYLITDISNGKRYVGSAYGEYMILGRWKSYIRTGNGGNVGLKKITPKHIQDNFKYSILDIYKSSTNDQIIIERECWWKDVLLSRQEMYGYNEN